MATYYWIFDNKTNLELKFLVEKQPFLLPPNAVTDLTKELGTFPSIKNLRIEGFSSKQYFVFNEGTRYYSDGFGVDIPTAVAKTTATPCIVIVEDIPPTPVGYTVSFETNGGIPILSPITGVPALPNPLPTVTKFGYAFEAWYTDTTFTTLATGGQSISADTMLYAKWGGAMFGGIVHTNNRKDICGTYIPPAPVGDLIYGVRWVETAGTSSGEQSNPVGERFIQYPDGTIKYGADTNLVAGMATLNADGSITRPRNDFDNIRPWSTRTRVTDSRGNVMVRTEPFYYKKAYEIIGGTSYWIEAISMTQYNGFVIPKGFIEAGAGTLSNNYTSAYEASDRGQGMAQSMSGFTPYVKITRANASIAISNISQRYHGLDLQSYDIFLMLFDIETATRNSQSVFAGVTNVGSAVATGQTDGLGAVPSGGYINNTDGQHSFRYRFQENPYGNVFKFVMGVNIRDYKTYVCEDYHYYGNTYTYPYSPVGYTNANAHGWSIQMGYDKNFPYANMPTIVGGTDSTYYCDNYGRGAGDTLVLVGGRWGSGANAGARYWACDFEFSVAAASFGFAFSSNTLS